MVTIVGKVAAAPKSRRVRPTAVPPGRIERRATLAEYHRKGGVDAYVHFFHHASPMERVEIERNGVSGVFLKDLSRKLGVPAVRFYRILGVPRATAAKKTATSQLIRGSGGQAAVGMVKLLGIAQDIVANSTSEAAAGFDTAKWLGSWIETPQAALGGRKPADLLDTPTGVEVVARLLGAIESGAYQ